MAEQGKQKASLISILLNTVSSLLAFGGIILIVYFINEGWYPTGYNVEHTEGGTIFLERGWKHKETLVIEEEASENLRDVSSMAAISISNYKSAFMGMASSFYSFYIAFIPVLFHLKKWDKKKVNKRLVYSAFLLFLTALITYQTMNIHTGVEEDWAEVEQQIEEEEETARSLMLKETCTQLRDADLERVTAFGHNNEKQATIRWGIWHIADHSRYHQANINLLRRWYVKET